MTVTEPAIIKTFTTPEALGQWLKEHHALETELWIKIYKKQSGIKSVSWNDVVIEALCWGWIDGLKKSLNEQAYLQRITPRRIGSDWSKRNTKHVENLMNAGKMMEPGLIHVRAAKADGRWDKAYVVSEMEVPTDFLAALENNHSAKQFFQTLTKSSRYVIAHGLLSAKKPETRAKRFTKFMNLLINQEKP